MKVKAKFTTPNKFGFYGGRRRYNGDVFEVEEKDFSKNWMVNLDAAEAPKPSKDGVKGAK